MRLILIILFISVNVMADTSERHMISFDTTGFGWSGAAETMTTKSSSRFEKLDDLSNNLAFNYAYRFSKRQQVGFFFQNNNDETKFKTREGRTDESKKELTSFGFFVLHNFHDNLHEAYFVGLSVSLTNIEEETSHRFTESEGKTPMETDDNLKTYEGVFGKRFSLKKWNIQNLVYSPQVSVFYRTHGKDFSDQGIRFGRGGTIKPIKFDLLF